MTRAPLRVAPAALALCAGLVTAACRDSSVSQALSTSLPIAPNTFGGNGCVGPDQTFMIGQVPSTVTLGTLAIGPSSQVTAVRGSEVLYATGAGATIVQLDFTGGPVPVETELVAAGTVAALYAQPAIGIVDPPELAAVAVLDADFLVVAERTANVLLLVDRAVPDSVSLLAGLPATTPGFADGFALPMGSDPIPRARFAFTGPLQLAVTGEDPPRVFATDPGNHAVRLLASGFVSTIAGLGTPAYLDGDLGDTGFDTPVGLAITCGNALLVTEGAGSVAGNRVRRLTVGAPSPFSDSLFGLSETLAGDGAAASMEGAGASASVAAPFSPLVTSAGEVYWIDATTGVLRRLAAGDVDCPLAVDCATAVGAPTFSPGGATSLAQTESGVLYALDAAAGTLFRVTP